jgi:hypothetical protein
VPRELVARFARLRHQLTALCDGRACLPRARGTQKMKGISILDDRLYSGYEPGKRSAMKRSSMTAL